MKTSIGFLGINSLMPSLNAIESNFAENKNMEGIIREFKIIQEGSALAINELKLVRTGLKLS